MPLPVSITPTQSNVQAALRSFLLGALPGVPGQDPAVFQGTIAGTTLTVSALPGLGTGGIQGSISVNSPLLGAAPGTTIVSQLTGTTGGVGTYQLSQSQTLSLPTTLSTGCSVVAGQQNRAAEPNNPWFCVFWPIASKRLATNFDASADVKFNATISGTTMTVNSVAIGTIIAPSTIFAPNVIVGTQILSQLSGTPGGAGTYSVSASQTVSVAQTMSAGGKMMTMSQELTVQIDFHSPDYQAADFAQTVSIALRDEFATTFFAALPAPQNNVSPLYADDPRQVPFINAENQYEWRWSLDAHLQVDETVAVPAEYADAVSVTPFFVP